jgi:hypothetical protein
MLYKHLTGTLLLCGVVLSATVSTTASFQPPDASEFNGDQKLPLSAFDPAYKGSNTYYTRECSKYTDCHSCALSGCQYDTHTSKCGDD